MGATGWSYTVPYEADMNKVLDDLHRDVFLRGAYRRPIPIFEALEELGFLEADEETREDLIRECGLEPLRAPIERVGPDGLRDWLEALYDAPKLQNMEELAALQCLSESGTHSILDIESVGQTRADDGIYPLPREFLLRYVGTAEPNRAAVEKLRERGMLLGEAYERGQGVYVILYRDGKPDEIYIEGASGD
jgi:hypothetical protein